MYWFEFDKETLDIFGGIHARMCREFPKKINEPKKPGELPYHMTMFAGLAINPGYIIETALLQLKPFTNGAIPIITGIEAVELPRYLLGVRFKFRKGSYLLTGNEKGNLEVARSLGVPNMNFNLMRHATICKVETKCDQDADMALTIFDELVTEKIKHLKGAKLTPTVWLKTDNAWQVWHN